jgi:cysteine desulfurase
MGIYFDHAATTPVDPRVLEKMLPYFSQYPGNASSSHSDGRKASRALAEARQALASAIGALPEEIYFTSGGTESDNWALMGMAGEAKNRHIITSAVEHHAVLDCCRALEKRGVSVTYLPVDHQGCVDPARLEEAIRPDTCLISIMYANNETGTIMPIPELARIASSRGIPFHTDAVQAVGHIPIDVGRTNISMLSLSAHKFYGPKGVGALYIRRGLEPEKLMLGGAQEHNRRAGTYNTPGIVGMGEAARLAAAEMEQRAGKERRLTQQLLQELSWDPAIQLNGSGENRLPGHLNLMFSGRSGRALSIYLDRQNVSVSLGAACSASNESASYVLQAAGRTTEEALSSVRFSLGWHNTEEEVAQAAEMIRNFCRL